MATDLQDQQVGVQEQVATEPAAQEEQSGGGETGANAESTNAQPAEQTGSAEGQTGQETLPPELEQTRKKLLQDYHVKTQKLAEDRRKLEAEVSRYKDDSGSLQQLMAQDWFKRALEQEKTRRTGKAQLPEPSDEDFQAIQNGDKKAFARAVAELAEKLVQEKVGGPLSTTAEKLKKLESDREFERVAARHKDFRDLSDQGLLDEYLQKGYDPEAAYKQYKFDQDLQELPKKVEQRAQELLQSKKAGSVATNGVSQVKGTKILKAKKGDWGDAFDKVWEAHMRGETDVRVEKE